MTKRNLIILMTSLAMALGLAACGDDDMPPPDGPIMMPDGPGMEGGVTIPPVPALGTQIDRAGRPAVSTALSNRFADPTDPDVIAAKAAYNADGDVAGWQAAYSAGFAASLAIFDGADTMCGNQLLAAEANADGTIPADRYSGLAGILADDRLYVFADAGGCGYLGVEGWIVGGMMGAPPCGGRMLGNDIIETSYSVLVAGMFDGIDDTITEDSATHSDTVFPFLAAPN